MKTPTLIATMLLLGAGLPAVTEETRCTGRIGAVALDNIFVPDGASCVLNKTRANGSVIVGTGTGTGATLLATSVSINGNL